MNEAVTAHRSLCVTPPRLHQAVLTSQSPEFGVPLHPRL
jgi:hypothetical protein